jgi:hypothetical protein
MTHHRVVGKPADPHAHHVVEVQQRRGPADLLRPADLDVVVQEHDAPPVHQAGQDQAEVPFGREVGLPLEPGAFQQRGRCEVRQEQPLHVADVDREVAHVLGHPPARGYGGALAAAVQGDEGAVQIPGELDRLFEPARMPDGEHDDRIDPCGPGQRGVDRLRQVPV